MSESSINARYERCIAELDTLSSVLDAITAWQVLAEDYQVVRYWHIREIARIEHRHEALTNLKHKLERQRAGFWSAQPNRKHFEKYARLKTELYRLLETNAALRANYESLLEEHKEISTKHLILKDAYEKLVANRSNFASRLAEWLRK
jgi:hypothetical protein